MDNTNDDNINCSDSSQLLVSVVDQTEQPPSETAPPVPFEGYQYDQSKKKRTKKKTRKEIAPESAPEPLLTLIPYHFHEEDAVLELVCDENKFCEETFNKNNKNHINELNMFLKSVLSCNDGHYMKPIPVILVVSFCENVDLISAIFSQFMQYSNNNTILHTIEFFQCDLSHFFFMNDDLITNHNDYSVSSSKRTISIVDCFILDDDDDDDINTSSSSSRLDTIQNTIRNCTIFSSWDIRYYYSNDNNDDIVFLLNALSQNEYVQSLHIKTLDTSRLNNILHPITNVVTCSKNLSKLGLELSTRCENFAVSTMAVSNFVDALVQSENITDIAFKNVGHFHDTETMHIMHSLFDRKPNIQKLQFDSTLFYDEEYNCYFNASIFSKLLNNNNYRLRELDVNFHLENNPHLHQQLLSFITLLKETCIETLTIQFNNGVRKYFKEELSDNVIPFMKKLQCLQLGGFLNSNYVRFQRSVGICNRTLSIVQLRERNSEYYIYKYLQKYFERNEKINNCIVNKTKCKPRVLPKLFYVMKPTGPDATYQILNYLGLSTGPRGKLTVPFC